MPIRIVLADDHPLIRDAVEAVCRNAGDLEVVAMCADGEEAMAALARHRPDVLLLDLAMPKLDGLGLLERMRARGSR